MYGSKVWHSNDKYRRVIWQCNAKFKNHEPCSTPHLTEQDIQEHFLRALNRLLSQRDFIRRDMEALMEMLADTAELEREAAALRDEMEVTAQLMRQAIAQNASMAMNQEGYVQRYQSLTERYTKAAGRVKAIEAECAQRTRKRDAMNSFLNTLLRCKEPVKEFTPMLWNTLLEKAVVGEDGRMRFAFKNGTEITVR